MLDKYFIIKLILVLVLIVSLLGLGYSMNFYSENSLASDLVESDEAEEGEKEESNQEEQEEESKSELELRVSEDNLQEIVKNSFFASRPEDEVENEEPEAPEPEPQPRPEPEKEPEDEEEEPEDKKELANPFQLQAVSDHVSEKRAIIYHSEENKTYIVKPGDKIDGYKIVEVKKTIVSLEKDGQQIKIEFEQ
ncbi:MAG: hypothetical protein ACOC5A_05435 [Halanaerobiales bacterium]